MLKKVMNYRLYSNHVPISYCSMSIIRQREYSSVIGSRQYFYVWDDKGQLFLHDCKHKNFVSCLKDKSFLNMMYRLLRRVPESSSQVKNEGVVYPLVSPCGKETNFLRVEDPIAAVVFGSIHPFPSTLIGSNDRFELVVGGSELRQEFHPRHLSVDFDSGRFYHTVLNHRHLSNEQGLLHGFISQQLSPMITLSEDGERFLLRWTDGKEYPIPPQPTHPTNTHTKDDKKIFS
eukprot:gene16764-19115_t